MGPTTQRLIVKESHRARRKAAVDFLIDSGAVYSLVPAATLASLGIRPHRRVDFTLADGRKITRQVGDAYFELAYAAQQNKQYELAIRVLEARAKLLPENAATYWIRAISFDNLRAYKQAAENYHRFLAADGGKLPDQEFQARHRLIAIEPKR